MQNTNKRQYTKPQLSSHGSVEEITGWHGGGSGEFFGGTRGGSSGKVAFRKNGPGDFGS
jgi:hypothetical protein